MPAYWFSSANVTDEAALADYAKLARPAIEKHGGRYLARGGRHVRLEGASTKSRTDWRMSFSSSERRSSRS